MTAVLNEKVLKRQNEFIKKAKEIHGDKYDYSKVEYIDSKTKVCIICPIHGEFWQRPPSHVSQRCGCPKCSNKNKTLNEVLAKCREIHGDKYDYSLITSANMSKVQQIKCNKCGNIFEMTLMNHIHAKRGCKYCSHRSYAYTTEEFIERARKVQGNKYDLSKVVYKNKKEKITIVCPIHGEFLKSPEHFLNGQGCHICSKPQKLTKEMFIEKSRLVHGDKYDYSKSEYKTVEDKVCIICPKHGEFWQTPHSHMSGNGCLECGQSRNVNEKNLYAEVKKKYGDEVIWQYKADWLKGQSIDIYIPSMKIGIEYQGIQHFEPIKYFGGEEKFEYTVSKDKEKYLKCKDNNVKLFYFSKEKKTPNKYLDNIYKNTETLIKEIEKYGNQ